MNRLYKQHALNIAIVAAITLGSVGLAGESRAATATANLAVSASVAANCIISTTPLAFGPYDPIVTNASAALLGAGSVVVTCTNGEMTSLTLGQGLNADAGSTDDAPLRRARIAATTNYLSYDLYSDAGLSTVWGNTTASDVTHNGTGLSQIHTVYGSMAGGQNVPIGNYVDTVVATVTF